LASKQIAIPLSAVVVLLLLRRGKFRWPPEAVWLLVSGTLLFLLAHAVLFKLFLPSRFTLYAWPSALLLLLAANLGDLIGRWKPRCDPVLLRRVFVAAAALAAAALLAGALVRKPKTPDAPVLALFEAISSLPKDSVIAGYPISLDDIPLRCRRSVFINREVSNHYYERYDRIVRERTKASLELLHAPTYEDALSIAREHGITHVLTEPGLYGNPDWGSRRRADPPHHELLDRLRTRRAHFAQPDPRFRVVHEDRSVRLLEIPQG
jgi:hypothetical protein